MYTSDEQKSHYVVDIYVKLSFQQIRVCYLIYIFSETLVKPFVNWIASLKNWHLLPF